MGTIEHSKAMHVANHVMLQLFLSCTRIQLAGSLRRGAAMVKDIEIVAVPKPDLDLLGQPLERDKLQTRVEQLIADGRFAWRSNASDKPGRRFYPLIAVKSGVPVDLFAVLRPAQWGAIYAIRTGPAEFSKRLVTECKKLGRRCVDGHLERADGSTIATPEEEDFFRACGVDYIDPEKR